MKKTPLFLGLLAVLALFCSCQKEVNWNDNIKFCGVSSITVRNAAGNVTEEYNYDYDTVLRRPILLQYHNLLKGSSIILRPVYAHDTIYLDENSFIITDGSRRIKTLTETNAATGKTLTYYYAYDNFGYLYERYCDDGINDAIRTKFSYDNGSLTGYSQDVQGYPQALSATVSYQPSTRFNAYWEYSTVELFPELILYLPAFQMGKYSNYAIKTVEKKIATGNVVSLTENYSNYSVTSEGWPEGFQTDQLVSGVTKATSRYEINYKCF